MPGLAKESLSSRFLGSLDCMLVWRIFTIVSLLTAAIVLRRVGNTSLLGLPFKYFHNVR